MILQRD